MRQIQKIAEDFCGHNKIYLGYAQEKLKKFIKKKFKTIWAFPINNSIKKIIPLLFLKIVMRTL